MAQTAAPPTTPDLDHHVTPAGHIPVQHAPVTPGKVAMWLFLATEIMFFTGLIGSYIVLRAGSPPRSYTNLYSPNTPLEGLLNTEGVFIEHVGSDPARVAAAIKSVAGLDEEHVKELARDHSLVNGLTSDKAHRLHDELESAGAHVEIERLKQYNWPKPYDKFTNPLDIDLTAANTFILICSSVAMVLALSAFQRDERKKGTLWLLATTLIGSVFLSIQVIEYYGLMFGHHYPAGISATGHFRPSASLFASCFFTMTGFHGAHVTGGVIALGCLTIRSALSGCTAYNKHHYSPVELIGLYWHFVDLVWIILFTLVYLL
ncbi:MAG: cytochrome c oxidase subunit 3 [Isosphaeraceae bacterium]|nr:cytochrome c oxidase subunit 3 [Isosphaeraceae bacterium]